MVERPPGEFKSFKEVTVGGANEERTLAITDWKPNRPRTDKEIWRYRPLGRFEENLKEGYLWFSRPDQFDDPYEGSLPKRNALKRYHAFTQDISAARSDVRELYRYIAYVNCWYSEKHESDAMWRQYGNGQGVIAFVSTPRQVIESISQEDPIIAEEDIFGGEVEYIEYDRDEIRTDDVAAPLFYKRKAFSFENEYRLLLHFTINEFDGLNSNALASEQPPGVQVQVDPQDMIEKVVVSPDVSDDAFNRLNNTVIEGGFDIDVHDSDIYGSPIF